MHGCRAPPRWRFVTGLYQCKRAFAVAAIANAAHRWLYSLPAGGAGPGVLCLAPSKAIPPQRQLALRHDLLLACAFRENTKRTLDIAPARAWHRAARAGASVYLDILAAARERPLCLLSYRAPIYLAQYLRISPSGATLPTNRRYRARAHHLYALLAVAISVLAFIAFVPIVWRGRLTLLQVTLSRALSATPAYAACAIDSDSYLSRRTLWRMTLRDSTGR